MTKCITAKAIAENIENNKIYCMKNVEIFNENVLRHKQKIQNNKISHCMTTS